MIYPWEHIPDPRDPFNDLNPHRSLEGQRRIWAENLRLQEAWEAKQKEKSKKRD